MRAPRLRAVAYLAALVLPSAACGGDAGAPSRAITVFAAASLTDSFTALGEAFEAANPGTEIVLSFAASSALVEQVLAGAPADAIATADAETMAGLDDHLDGEPQPFARTSLAIVVQRGNPMSIRGLADLAASNVVLVVCSPEVPCGRLAAEVLDGAAVDARPRSLEANVRAVVSRVSLGEADAGIVYVTDVHGARDRTEAVAIADEHNVTTTFPLARLVGSSEPDLVDAFVGFVLSAAGQDILRDAGFEAP